MSALADEVARRYPVLGEVHLSSSDGGAPETVPTFFGLLLALAESDNERGCCIVVPDPAGVAHVLATLLTLVRLRKEFDVLTRAWAERGFEVGQRVKVNPTGHVYVYEGVFEKWPHLYKLRELGTDDDARSLRVSEILRLEPTDRQRPKGKLATDLQSYDAQPIDRLLGIESWGNESLFRNRVLVLSSRTRFDRFLSGTAACRSGDAEGAPLSEILPWGSMDDAGGLQPADAFQVRGEPVVAVTHDVDVLADGCALVPDGKGGEGPMSGFASGPAVVVAEGSGRLVRNLRSLDDISSKRKVIAVVGPDDEEGLALLADRGLAVWRASPDEMLLEAEGAAREAGDGLLFGGFTRSAQNMASFRLDGASCADGDLDLAAAALVLAVDAVRDTEGEDELLSTVRSLFGVLFRASERLSPYSDEERASATRQIAQVPARLEQRAQWVGPDVAELVEDAMDALREAVESDDLGRAKADVLARLLGAGDARVDGGEAAVTVLVRYAGSRSHVEAWLHGQGRAAIVSTDRTLPERWCPDHVVALSWLGAERFRRLVDRYPSPRLTAVSYPFELDWMRQFERRWRRKDAQLPAEERAALCGLSPSLFPGVSGDAEADMDMPDDAIDVFRMEAAVLHRRKGGAHVRLGDEEVAAARYVGFVGDTYAWLTEGASVPVVTALVHGAVDGARPRRHGVSRRTVSELQAGDFVLFREGSDHDVTRSFAEAIAGPAAYRELRQRATVWRRCLQDLSTDPVRVHRLLREAGLSRRPVTVQKWLEDGDRIGPQDLVDLEVVARAAGPFPEPVAEVWEAIREVRAYHAKAGHRISEWLLEVVPKHADRLRDGEARLDLEFGTTYVVEVEAVDAEQDDVPSRLVNELLWDTSG